MPVKTSKMGTFNRIEDRKWAVIFLPENDRLSIHGVILGGTGTLGANHFAEKKESREPGCVGKFFGQKARVSGRWGAAVTDLQRYLSAAAEVLWSLTWTSRTKTERARVVPLADGDDGSRKRDAAKAEDSGSSAAVVGGCDGAVVDDREMTVNGETGLRQNFGSGEGLR